MAAIVLKYAVIGRAEVYHPTAILRYAPNLLGQIELGGSKVRNHGVAVLVEALSHAYTSVDHKG